MLRRLRAVVMVALFALVGAVAGRFAADLRRQTEAGEEPHIDLDAIIVRPRDVVPGLVAAMRVRDRPWSYLHIPSWLAALCVNFGLAALGGDLEPLRRMARGLGDFGFDPGSDFDDKPPAAPDQPPAAWDDDEPAAAAAGASPATAPPPPPEPPAGARPAAGDGFAPTS